MGKYRTSPYKFNCVEIASVLLFWGSFCFVSPPPVAGAFTTGISDPFTAEKHGGHAPLVKPNCTPSGLNDFPTDFFNKEQRVHGAVVLHFFISFYAFYALFIVCDDYFVPAIEAITRDLGISTDLAGATFMAISTSAPELFTNVIGTFVTKGDLGVGTIVGSAVFNILAVGCCCGLGAGFAVQKHKKKARPGIELDWWPLTRDCLFYLIAVLLLLLVLRNRRIYWYEALTLLLFYCVYVLVMCNNALFKSWAERLVSKCSSKKTRTEFTEKTEKTPILSSPPMIKSYTIPDVEVGQDWAQQGSSSSDTSSEDDEILLKKALSRCESRCQEEQEEMGLWKLPVGGCGTWLIWFGSWPIRLVLTLTIPDCREERWRRWYVITLIMCICWIASLTYIVSWMMEVIGDTLDMPESVTGLTFLAAGTSIPEVISSVLVARQGFGAMGLSNSIGSNTFDLLFCLGLPWLIESLLMMGTDVPYVAINSGGIEYSVALLITFLILFYFAVAINGFVLDWRVGLSCLLMYGTFLPIASLLELNFFFPVNLPPC